jgi:pilus assembly protein CpaE
MDMAARILIIDDSTTITKLVKYQFVAEGYDVVTAEDGPAGLQAAEEYTPDLILLDVMMPEMDGYEVCRRLRAMEKTRSTPIVMLTSMTSIANMQAGFEAGADDYITKPFESAELKMRVGAILRRSGRVQADEQALTGRVITIFSLRGGAGCSSLATNLAVGLSQLWRTEAVLVDLALPTGLCDVMLNLKPSNNLGTLAQQEVGNIDWEYINNILVTHPASRTRLLGGIVAPHEAELVSDNLVMFLLDHLSAKSHYVVVDTSHNFSPPILAALDRADHILMPITPDISSVRLALSTLKVFDQLGYPEEKVDVIVNWTFPKAGIAANRIEKAIGHPVRMVIPHVPAAWSEAINEGVPVISRDDPESPLVAMLEDLAWRMSSPADRGKKPVEPGEMWQRVIRRWQEKKQG